MVLFPLHVADPIADSTRPIPVWNAIEERQRQAADHWWLILQPDHAALAADLAAAIRSPIFPTLDAKVIEAIRLHDQGWLAFDRADLEHDTRRSFLDVPPAEFLSAWRASIAIAQQSSPLGGLLVSRHFCAIGRQASHSSKNDERRIFAFLAEEAERQIRLISQCGRTAPQVDELLTVLQFCDLLSLYLTCGAQAWAEFPPHFGSRVTTVQKDGGIFRTNPALFSSERNFTVPAISSQQKPGAGVLSFFVA